MERNPVCPIKRGRGSRKDTRVVERKSRHPCQVGRAVPEPLAICFGTFSDEGLIGLLVLRVDSMFFQWLGLEICGKMK